MDQEKEKIIVEKEALVDELKHELLELHKETADSNIQNIQLKNQIEDLQNFKSSQKEDEQSKRSLQKTLIEMQKKHKDTLTKEMDYRKALIQQQEKLSTNLEKASKENNDLMQKNVALEFENDSLKNQQQTDQMHARIVDELMEQNEQLQTEVDI